MKKIFSLWSIILVLQGKKMNERGKEDQPPTWPTDTSWQERCSRPSSHHMGGPLAPCERAHQPVLSNQAIPHGGGKGLGWKISSLRGLTETLCEGWFWCLSTVGRYFQNGFLFCQVPSGNRLCLEGFWGDFFFFWYIYFSLRLLEVLGWNFLQHPAQGTWETIRKSRRLTTMSFLESGLPRWSAFLFPSLRVLHLLVVLCQGFCSCTGISLEKWDYSVLGESRSTHCSFLLHSSHCRYFPFLSQFPVEMQISKPFFLLCSNVSEYAPENYREWTEHYLELRTLLSFLYGELCKDHTAATQREQEV